jgi:hypothetical protein
VNVRNSWKGTRGYLKAHETLHQGSDDDVWVELPGRSGLFENVRQFKKCNVALVEAPPQLSSANVAPKPSAEDSATAAPTEATEASISGSTEWSPESYPGGLLKLLFDNSSDDESSVDEPRGSLDDSNSREDCESMIMITDIVGNDHRYSDSYESRMTQTFSNDPLP